MCIHNVPISKVEDKDFVSLLVCEGTSYHIIVDTMFQLSLIVEKKIASEMKGKKGIIMHDGWSKFARHYLAILACYLVATDKRDRKGEVIMEPVITLLTCTTLPQLAEANDADTDGEFNICLVLFDEVISIDASILSLSAMSLQTATTFNAEAHVALIKQTFVNLNVDVSKFAIGQVCDSTNLNPRIATMLKISHIACRNHYLNLGCKDMEKNCTELSDLAEKTQDLHRKIKASNKLSAELENIQLMEEGDDDRKPHPKKLKLQAATRWNSMEGLFTSHVLLGDNIREVIKSHPDRELSDETISRSFITKINKHLPYLKELKCASVNMQTKLATLEYCQFQCDGIITLAAQGQSPNTGPGHDFEYCK